MSNTVPKILITGATEQVGGKTIDYLMSQDNIEIVAAIRDQTKAAEFNSYRAQPTHNRRF